MNKVYWVGKEPTCEVCDGPINSRTFVDGKTRFSGRWALMCERCHREHGYGIGLGRGQRYLTATREKIEG